MFSSPGSPLGNLDSVNDSVTGYWVSPFGIAGYNDFISLTGAYRGISTPFIASDCGGIPPCTRLVA